MRRKPRKVSAKGGRRVIIGRGKNRLYLFSMEEGIKAIKKLLSRSKNKKKKVIFWEAGGMLNVILVE